MASGWIALLAFTGCSGKQREAPAPSATTVDLETQIGLFCGDCHAPPNPETFAAQHWPAEVERGFEFYRVSGRSDLTPPPVADTVEYYQSRAPARIPLPDPLGTVSSDVGAGSGAGGTFVFRPSKVLVDQPAAPGVSHILPTESGLLFTDMQSGVIGKVRFEGREPKMQSLASARHPAHVEIAPWDVESMVVAELGSFAPDDHDRGALLSVMGNKSTNLMEKIGRVADAKLADFDGDGYVDIAVAEFGWHETGALHLMWGKEDGQWERQTISRQHGFSHLAPADIDDDGDLDLVALQSQEHESVHVLLNQGERTMNLALLAAAPIPDFGYSSMQVVDLDGDGDQDILTTNGDSMDSMLLKPHHGVRWHENLGNLSFEAHTIGILPGVYGAACGDLDGDGDEDIVACTMTWWDDLPFDTLVCYERLSDGTYRAQSLDLSTDQHACVAVNDFDQDGRPDIAVGEFHRDEPKDFLMSIWWNETPQ